VGKDNGCVIAWHRRAAPTVRAMRMNQPPPLECNLEQQVPDSLTLAKVTGCGRPVWAVDDHPLMHGCGVADMSYARLIRLTIRSSVSFRTGVATADPCLTNHAPPLYAGCFLVRSNAQAR